MAYYHNEHFKSSAQTTAGPYTFKYGVISTTEENDKVVGRILLNFYGCKKISEAEARVILKDGEAQSAKAAADEEAKAAKEAELAAAAQKKIADEAAKTQAEAAAKAKAEAEADAEAKAKADAEAKAKASTDQNASKL